MRNNSMSTRTGTGTDRTPKTGEHHLAASCLLAQQHIYVRLLWQTTRAASALGGPALACMRPCRLGSRGRLQMQSGLMSWHPASSTLGHSHALGGERRVQLDHVFGKVVSHGLGFALGGMVSSIVGNWLDTGPCSCLGSGSLTSWRRALRYSWQWSWQWAGGAAAAALKPSLSGFLC